MYVPVGVVQATNIVAKGFGIKGCGFGNILHVNQRVGKHCVCLRRHRHFLFFDWVLFLWCVWACIQGLSSVFLSSLPSTLLCSSPLSFFFVSLLLSCLVAFCSSLSLPSFFALWRGSGAVNFTLCQLPLTSLFMDIIVFLSKGTKLLFCPPHLNIVYSKVRGKIGKSGQKCWQWGFS